jgi:hypothetical protein
MKTCVCGYEFTDALSPDQHRAHRDHHMKRFPKAGDKTREALDELVKMAERSRQIAAIGPRTMRDGAGS